MNVPTEPEQQQVPDLERAAYHEAGHAVAAHILGLQVMEVSVELSVTGSDGQRWGHCRCTPSPDGNEYATVHSAGEAAVFLHCGVREPIDEDALRVVGIAHSQFGDDPQRVGTFIDEVQLEAQGILERHWAAVQAIATALLRYRTLHGQRAKEIIDSALAAGRVAHRAANEKQLGMRSC